MFIDLHMHSTASDGTDSPDALAEKISHMNGVKIFSLTDHDTISGVDKIKKLLPREIFFINGVEFSCKIAGVTKCHILGYFIDKDNADIKKIFCQSKALRKIKFDKRIDYLSKAYNINLSEVDIAEICRADVVGKPHIVNFVADKFGIAKEKLYQDLRRHHGGGARVDADLAIQAIINAGGVAVWAHPLGGEGEATLPQDEFHRRLNQLINLGIGGLECYYSRYNDAQEYFLARTANENNLLISGGSDYHGQNKNIALGELGTDAPNVKVYQLTILQKIFELHEDCRVRRAFDVAKAAHAEQVDKAGVEYICHPMTVALHCDGDISAMIVALLHDVVEDTSLNLENLRERLALTNEEMTALNLLTHDKNIPYFDYVQRVKPHAIARQVKVADLKHNSDISRIPEAVRTEKDFARIEKYKQALKILT